MANTGFAYGVLDPNSSGSSGVLLSGTFQHQSDTKATILAPGYFNREFDKFRRIGVLRIFASDGRVDCDVYVDTTERTVTLVPFGTSTTPPPEDEDEATFDSALLTFDSTLITMDAEP